MDGPELPNNADVRRAAARIAARIVRTPMLRNAALDRATGGTILIKPECLQKTGSFKLRGATNAIGALAETKAPAGVVAYSSGNHGQAVACAAAALGIAATIFMPADAPAIKRRATEAWGATVIPFDRLTDDREALAQAHAEATGAAIIPPFDHPEVMAGQGTAALELAEDAAAAGLVLDSMLVCAGGGGLIAGTGLALDALVDLFAVEPAGWDDTARSLAVGERVRNQPGGSPLCDALLAPMPGRLTFALNRARLAGGLVVTDEEVFAAMRFAFEALKLVVEPGGAVALAGLLAGRFDARGRVTGLMLSGGNVDPPVFARALAA